MMLSEYAVAIAACKIVTQVPQIDQTEKDTKKEK